MANSGQLFGSPSELVLATWFSAVVRVASGRSKVWFRMSGESSEWNRG
eukprot:CAMPEP_0177559558 /NCGR_PEP_ID=MMETSP0369-20130122/70906_1 /TAXON_ID=447022 ORGANISM="Scrippsiella hangoei-like, Strain SHHI-4" /NCGR_SAMPLE_ID=MMETSP0369 /ASSEMBLY_ACC=CAM_ASM_000364 /LENGTH=47 /DNA_ID= /DNA_START= /DNA_END= /DNA_ORIENTATION=